MNAVRVAIHGWSGSGKSAVCRYLNDTHGLAIASTGAMCRQITRTLFASEDRHLLNEVSVAMRGIRRDIWIEASLRATKSDRVVFDSIRYSTDVDVLRSAGFEIWSITCPPEVAQRRLRERGQRFTLADLNHESEIGLMNAAFDMRIDNGDRTWAAVCSDIDAAIASLGRVE